MSIEEKPVEEYDCMLSDVRDEQSAAWRDVVRDLGNDAIRLGWAFLAVLAFEKAVRILINVYGIAR